MYLQVVMYTYLQTGQVGSPLGLPLDVSLAYLLHQQVVYNQSNGPLYYMCTSLVRMIEEQTR